MSINLSWYNSLTAAAAAAACRVLLYTQRRAADLSAPNHTWCMGTEIGVATSENNGKRWKYQGVAKGLHFEPGYPQVLNLFAVTILSVCRCWT